MYRNSKLPKGLELSGEVLGFMAVHALATVNEDADASAKSKKGKVALDLSKILRPVNPPLSDKTREV